MRNCSLLAAVAVITVVCTTAILLWESGLIHAVNFTLERIAH